MNTDDSPRCRLLERGRGGIIGYLVPRPGYGQCTRHIPDLRLEPYLGELEDGGYAVDITAIRTERIVEAIWHAPLLDLRLEAGEVDACPRPTTVLVEGLAGTFLALAAKKFASPEWSGLDAVGLADYLAYWREAGARVGRMQGGTLVWEAATNAAGAN